VHRLASVNHTDTSWFVLTTNLFTKCSGY